MFVSVVSTGMFAPVCGISVLFSALKRLLVGLGGAADLRPIATIRQVDFGVYGRFFLAAFAKTKPLCPAQAVLLFRNPTRL